MTNEIVKAIEKSPMWKVLNEKVKEKYEEAGRTPSEEEYKAVRKMLMLKVMKEDPKVKETVTYQTYMELRKEGK